MNLMKLFNLNYLKQNVKKSKVILSIFIGLIPILNTIILIMAFSSGNNYVFNFTIRDYSGQQVGQKYLLILTFILFKIYNCFHTNSQRRLVMKKLHRVLSLATALEIFITALHSHQAHRNSHRMSGIHTTQHLPKSLMRLL